METFINEELENINLKTETVKKEKKKEYWYYESLKHLSNEEIVELIQTTDKAIYWDELNHRTEKLYSSVIKKVNEYYKKSMREDIMSILKIGWIKAVKFYDAKKATADFIPYCSFLMFQQYQMFARRITKDKIGSSVRDEPLSCVSVDGHADNDKMTQGCIDIIMKYDCEEYIDIEDKDFANDLLRRLKLHDEIQYMIVKGHCIDGITYKDLGQTLGMSQSAVSRHMKKGVAFLIKELSFEENMINIYNK